MHVLYLQDFGEYALITKEVRSASVVAEKVSECLVVLRDLFKKCLSAHTERQINVMVEQAKRASYLFSNARLNINIDKFIRKLFHRFSRVTVNTDTMLQVEGKKVKVVTLLIKGHCREHVTIKHEHGHQIGLISEFDHCAQNAIGAEYVTQNRKCRTSVVCTTQCELLIISSTHFLKSITSDMVDQIKEMGDLKAAFIQQRIASFGPKLSHSMSHPDLFNDGGGITRETLYSLRSRHGKWGEQEIKHIDDMLRRNSMVETDETSVPHDQLVHDPEDSSAPRWDGVDGATRHDLGHRQHRADRRSERLQNTLVSVPSIEKIAIRIRSLPEKVKRQRSRCQRRKRKGAYGQFLKTRRDLAKTQSLQSLQQAQNHQIARDLVSEETKRKHGAKLNRFNDLMPSNFYNVSDSKQTQQYLYGRLLRALQKKQVEKHGVKTKVAKINMKLATKNAKAGNHVFGALTPKSSAMRRHSSLPMLSARKRSVPHSGKSKAAKSELTVMSRSRTQK